MAAAADNPPAACVTVHYWGSFSGRSQPILLLLADAGVPYQVASDVKGFKAANPGFPAFAAPIYQDGAFVLAQTTAILSYLGQKHGYVPGGGGDAELAASCLQAACDAADIWAEAYKARRGEDKGVEFLQGGRLASWLIHLAASLEQTPGPYVFGDEASFADFAIANMLYTLDYMFGAAVIGEMSQKPIAEFRDAFLSRPAVAKFFASGAQEVLYESVKAQ